MRPFTITIAIAAAAVALFTGGIASADHYDDLHHWAVDYEAKAHLLHEEVDLHPESVSPLAHQYVEHLDFAAHELHDATDGPRDLHRVQVAYNRVAQLHWQVERMIGHACRHHQHPHIAELWRPMSRCFTQIRHAMHFLTHPTHYPSPVITTPSHDHHRIVVPPVTTRRSFVSPTQMRQYGGRSVDVRTQILGSLLNQLVR